MRVRSFFKRMFRSEGRIIVGAVLVSLLLYGGTSLGIIRIQESNETTYYYSYLWPQLRQYSTNLTSGWESDTVQIRWSVFLDKLADDNHSVLLSRLYDEQGNQLAQSGPLLTVIDTGGNRGTTTINFSLFDFFALEELEPFLKEIHYESSALMYSGSIGYYTDGQRVIPASLTLKQEEKKVAYAMQKAPPTDLNGLTYLEEASDSIYIDAKGFSARKAAAYRKEEVECQALAKKLVDQNLSGQYREAADGIYGSTGGGNVYSGEMTEVWRFQGKSYYVVQALRYDTGWVARENSAYVRGWFLILICLLMFCFAGGVVRNTRKRQKLENKRRELTNSIAHELKTPLAVIHGYSECLLEQVSPEKNGQYLQGILRETEGMAVLLQDMLEFSRMEMQEESLRLSSFSLAALIREELERMRPVAYEKNVVFSFPTGPVGMVTADREKLRLVLSNFLSNAVRHTPQGGVVSVHLTVPFQEHVIRVAICNPGDPIPPEKLNRIWEAFYRTDEARDRAAGGTGLGLALAREILVRHRALYGCRNTKDGVEFWFELPKKEEH